MKIVYINLVPESIKNEQILKFLKEFVDLFDITKIPIKNAEDMYPGVNRYIKSILDYYYSKNGKGKSIAGEIEAFFKILNEYRSSDEINPEKTFLGEDELIYHLLDRGFKKKIIFANCKIVIISGEKYKLGYPYGEASHNNVVCINRCLEKYSMIRRKIVKRESFYLKNKGTR